MALNLQALLADPFGPYADEDILSHKFPARGVVPVLEELSIACNGNRDFGFDDTEFLAEPPRTSPVNSHAVYLYGILEVRSLEWLSERGVDWLQFDLRQRDERLNDIYESELTLQSLYGDGKNGGSRLKVRLCCEKLLYAMFLTDKQHPNDLVVHTKDHHRKYVVASLDSRASTRSQYFFMRQRLLSLIGVVIQTDPDSTPIEERTVEYFVNQYQARFMDEDRRRRIIYTSNYDGVDVDSAGNSKRDRRPRYVSRAELNSQFAAHCEWLLAYQLAPQSSSHQMVNIRKWIDFCNEARSSRQKAREHGLEWGIGDNEDTDAEALGDRLARFGGNPESWRRKIQAAMKNKTKKTPKIPAVREQSPEIPLYPVPVAPVRFRYDSDFSESSTPAASDSESEPESITSHLLLQRIPVYCMTQPILPLGTFEWRCPGCHYRINILSVQDEQLQGLSPRLADIMRRKSWTLVSEPDVQTAFNQMVSNHYDEDMQKNNVRVVRKGCRWEIISWPPEEGESTLVNGVTNTARMTGSTQSRKQSMRRSKIKKESY